MIDIDSLPTPTMIFNASRRLKHPAAGEDGTRAEHLRAVCRHKVGRINLFHDFVVERVQDWWLHGHEREAPRQWDACKTCTLFKKGDASNPGNCRSIMMLVVKTCSHPGRGSSPTTRGKLGGGARVATWFLQEKGLRRCDFQPSLSL